VSPVGLGKRRPSLHRADVSVLTVGLQSVDGGKVPDLHMQDDNSKKLGFDAITVNRVIIGDASSPRGPGLNGRTGGRIAIMW
jgi:hypothetical protein